MEKLTQAELKRRLNYNPDTGIFTWRVSPNGRLNAGDIAGTIRSDGYVQIMVMSTFQLAHRLAHLYMEGYFPEHDMDHKKGIRSDNRWSELQHSTRSCNMQNMKTAKNNTSGFTGVTWNKKDKKWQGHVAINGKRIFLGYHDTPLNAALARYTFEVQCPQWKCNHRSELAKAIKASWPEFTPQG